MARLNLNPWFEPIVKPVEAEEEAPWIEVDPRGNEHVRRWVRPKTTDHWNTASTNVYGKHFLFFLPFVVLPLILAFWHPYQRNEYKCFKKPGGRDHCERVGYYFTLVHSILTVADL